MYVSFDDGANWQPFQQNLPVVPINDIKVFRKDLVIATQGRAFWIMDDLTPLHQATASVTSAKLFAPRDAYRMRYSYDAGFGRARGPWMPQYPPPGAMIDYAIPATGADVTLDISDSTGKVVRSFSSTKGEVPDTTPATDEESFGRRGLAAVRLPAAAGLNRFIWDLRWPGTDDRNGQAQADGPMVVPGTYKVRLRAGAVDQTQTLVVREDPRVAADGVTLADLRDQLAHEMRVRDLVNDAQRAARRLREARTRLKDATGAAADTLARLKPLEDELFTPPIRYSTPGLLAHITYLYSMTNSADQKVGMDAKQRYTMLRAQLDKLVASLNGILGPS